MSKPDDSAFRVRWALQLSAQLQELHSAQLIARVRRVAEMLGVDPYRAARAERLTADLGGLRSARIDRRLRLLYRICGECRTMGDQERRALQCCSSGRTTDATVNLLYVVDYHPKGLSDVPLEFDFEDD